MNWLRWDHTLELGHDEMDADHRQLLALVNRLAQGVVDNLEKNAYDALLDDLFAFTKAHFGREERLMDACCFPHAEDHRAEHARG